MGKGLGIPPPRLPQLGAAPHLLPPRDGLGVGGFSCWLLPLPPWLCPPARTRYCLGPGWGGQQGFPPPPPVSLLSLPPLQPGFALKRGLWWSKEGKIGERAGCCWPIPDPSSTLHHHAAVLAQHTPGPDPAQAPCLCGRRMGPLLWLLLAIHFVP